MTRHYYHENEDVLRQAVAAIPAIGTGRAAVPSVALPAFGTPVTPPRAVTRQGGVPARLKRLDKYLTQGLITQEEHNIQRARILAEL